MRVIKILLSSAFVVIFSIVVSSCSKKKSEKGLVGEWKVNSSSSNPYRSDSLGLLYGCSSDQYTIEGTMVILDDNSGYIDFNTLVCNSNHSLFYVDITDFFVSSESREKEALLPNPGGEHWHWYQGYINDDIYFNLNSKSKKKISKKTQQLELNIGFKVDNETGEAIEEYNIIVVLDRI
jgi:hypothetical protein